MSRRALAALFVALTTAAPLAAQQTPAPRASRVTVSFENATIQDVIAFFARYSGRSIVSAGGLTATVSGQIADQPWDVALDALLRANGLSARELSSGIILVESPGTGPGTPAEAPGRMVSRVFRLSYQPARELEPVVKSMLTARGSVATVVSINALVVTDEERVIERVAAILGQI